MIKETDQSRAHPLVKNIVQFSMTGLQMIYKFKQIIIWILLI